MGHRGADFLVVAQFGFHYKGHEGHEGDSKKTICPDGFFFVPFVPFVVSNRATTGTDVPTKDCGFEFRFRLGGAQSVTAEFDDRAFTGSHYGHICMARIAAQGIILTDQKEGGAKNEIQAMANDPAKKADQSSAPHWATARAIHAVWA